MKYNTLFCHVFCDQNNGVRVFPPGVWRKREIQEESDLLIASCKGLMAFVKCNVLGAHLDGAVWHVFVTYFALIELWLINIEPPPSHAHPEYY